MQYVCLVYHEEAKLDAQSPAEKARLDADSLNYDETLAASGHLIVAQALQSVKASKCVRVRKGKRLVTDGPFAETKEQLLGFVMINAGDLDEALDIAAGIPLGKMGTIEVRAVYDIPDPR
jgi:hypothetical protein